MNQTLISLAHAGHGADAHPVDHGLGTWLVLFAVVLLLGLAQRGGSR